MAKKTTKTRAKKTATKCTDCDRVFTTKQGMRIHHTLAHKSKPTEATGPNPPEGGLEGKAFAGAPDAEIVAKLPDGAPKAVAVQRKSDDGLVVKIRVAGPKAAGDLVEFLCWGHTACELSIGPQA